MMLNLIISIFYSFHFKGHFFFKGGGCGIFFFLISQGEVCRGNIKYNCIYMHVIQRN